MLTQHTSHFAGEAEPSVIDLAEQDLEDRLTDWTRERYAYQGWCPARGLTASLRAYQAARRRGGVFGWALARWAVLQHRWWSVATGADIPLNCKIRGGLLLPHPNGIVIHPDVRIGRNCLIFQQVTLGHAKDGVPSIGDNVDIGAGAKVLGAIRIGDGARIGANAVVNQDVPAGATAVGIPARIVGKARRDGDSLDAVHTRSE